MRALLLIIIFAGLAACIVVAAPLFGDWQARVAEANSRAVVAQANARIAESTASVAIAAVTANTLLVAIVVGGALALAGIVLYFQLRKDEMMMQLHMLEQYRRAGDLPPACSNLAIPNNRSRRIKDQPHIPTGAFRDDFHR